MGSMRLARRAGMKLANRAARMRTEMVMAKVGASAGKSLRADA